MPDVSFNILAIADQLAQLFRIAGVLLERIGMLKQSAFRIMQVGFPRAVCLDHSLGIAP